MSLDLTSLDGRVELRELLGQGGMGEVHAAWDRALARPVAVKFVRDTDPRAFERLLLEARLQARVEHPHVVRVLELGTLSGRPCILLGLVRGRTLGELASSLTVAERVELVRQAASGLHAAHAEGLVHRDVKPANILVEEGEGGGKTALVTDFGLAHAEEGGLTRSGLLPGTLDFMAPEQLAGEGPVDFRSDVYALGATLYAVLAGRPPFRIPSSKPDASGEEQVRLLRRILEEEPPPLQSVAPEVPLELSLVAGKAMEKEPAARYPTAEAFAQELARFQRGEPIRARPATPSERALKWARRNPAAARAGGAALAVLVLAGAFTLWLSRRAGLEALEAARLGAVASSLESRMRMESLLPLHDLRPARAAVKAEVEALRPLAARGGGGPAAYALGKGLELLGELDEARAAYERAWALGFRTPAAAEGLGAVLARLYQREYTLAVQTLPSEARAARVAQLGVALREPARRYLERGDATGWRGPLLRAQEALLEGDFAVVRARAAEALALDPGRYEARTLEGEAWIGEARLFASQDHLDKAAEAAEHAVPAIEAAVAAGRSDARAHRLLVDALGLRVHYLVAAGRDPTAASTQARAAFAAAAVPDPDDPDLLLGRGRALEDLVQYEAMQGHHGALELSDESCALLRRAARAAPKDPTPLIELAHALYIRSIIVQDWTGGAPEREVDEAAEASAAALALAPGRADVVRSRAISLYALARSRQSQGKDALPALEELEVRCREAEQLDPKRAASLREVLLEGLELRGKEDWRRGADPRPAFERATALAEELLTSSSGRRAAASQAATVFGSYAITLMEMGEDPAAQARKALALAEEDLDRNRKVAALQANVATMLLVEAKRQVLAGLDPTSTVAEARHLLTSASAGQASLGNLNETWGWVARIEALWLAASRGDPSAALGRCERAYEQARAEAGESAVGPKGIATCALDRAAWLGHRSATDAATVARRGLTEARRAAELDPRDPVILLLQARLQALSGDREGGRSTLAAAYAAQPLLRGSRDAKAVEVELAAAP